MERKDKWVKFAMYAVIVLSLCGTTMLVAWLIDVVRGT